MKKPQSEVYFDQLCKGCKEVIVGLFLLLVAIVVLFRNEGIVAQRYQILEELRRSVVSVGPERTSIVNENLLLHVVGEVEAQDPVIDEEYGVISKDAIKMRRVVSMYQWHENVDDSVKNQTQYFYTKHRSQTPIDSTRFHEPGYDNPPFPKSIAAEEQVAKDVYLGDFRLSEDILASIQDYELLALTGNHLVGTTGTGASLGSQSDRIIQEDTILQKQNDTSTGFEVGDVSISFQVVPEGMYTVVAEQDKETLIPYDTHAGGEIFFVKKGEVVPARMFAEMTQLNIMVVWGIRFFGVFIVIFAMMMVLKPTKIIMCGYIHEAGKVQKIQLAVASTISLAIAFMINALAWMFIRPRLSGIMIALALAVVLSLTQRQKIVHKFASS